MMKNNTLINKILNEIEKEKVVNEKTSPGYFSSEKLEKLINEWNMLSKVEKEQQEKLSKKTMDKIMEDYNSVQILSNLIFKEEGLYKILRIKGYTQNLELSRIKKNQLILFTQLSVKENIEIGGKIILDLPENNLKIFSYKDINNFLIFKEKVFEEELKFVEHIYKFQTNPGKLVLLTYLNDYYKLTRKEILKDLITKLINIEKNSVDYTFKKDLKNILTAKNEDDLHRIINIFKKKISNHLQIVEDNPDSALLYATTLIILIKIVISGTMLTKSLIFLICYFTGLDLFFGNPDYLQ